MQIQESEELAISRANLEFSMKLEKFGFSSILEEYKVKKYIRETISDSIIEGLTDTPRRTAGLRLVHKGVRIEIEDSKKDTFLISGLSTFEHFNGDDALIHFRSMIDQIDQLPLPQLFIEKLIRYESILSWSPLIAVAIVVVIGISGFVVRYPYRMSCTLPSNSVIFLNEDCMTVKMGDNPYSNLAYGGELIGIGTLAIAIFCVPPMILLCRRR
jgi:hypothetical protein